LGRGGGEGVYCKAGLYGWISNKQLSGEVGRIIGEGKNIPMSRQADMESEIVEWLAHVM